MVVMWCKECGALMGMREPMSDWSTDKGVCPICLPKLSGELPPGLGKAADEEPTGKESSEGKE